jgi:hypothetical protein
MDRMISYFIAICVAAFLGFGAAERPEVGWHTHFLFWNPGFTIPAGPVVQARAQAAYAQTSLKQCSLNSSRQAGALTAQEASVQAERAQSAAWVAASAKEARARTSDVASWNRKADAILAQTTKSPDLCKAADDVLKGAGQ